jgi:hypothetical protein
MDHTEFQQLAADLSTKLEELKQLHRQLIQVVEGEFAESFPDFADEMKAFLDDATNKLEGCYDEVFKLHLEVIVKVLKLMKEKQPFIM